MKTDKKEKRGGRRTLLAAAAVIGSCTLLFQGITQAATVWELKKTSAVPTSYTTPVASPAEAELRLPAGYTKANYTVKPLDLEFYRDNMPTTKDMSREDAAEIGAQALWELFDLSLEGQIVEMGFHPATDHFPRSYWHGDVLIDDNRSYSFSVDSVTGELLTIGRSRTLLQQTSVAYDPDLAANPAPYVKLARQLAEKWNVVHSAVQSVEYNSQGYINNDPTISLEITGENGETALMTFSRSDQALLGIVYDGHYSLALASHERYVKEMLETINKLEKQAPPAAPNEPPVLRALP